ncbi:TonB-dependent receptor domain-containing protein [Epilithonimonas arachidiradicis]|uniref:Outer membrane receptor protein involved in Fe transport n=1 Tax=Epilithonimonas arachidiradicis TaxID=1617282 RepID=A0A420DDN8_9FLAO|nr:TonB-dependent receptor [Epilithonimonas arachidiradicis]RKE89991.1 outer membrane receptor protein involved in Fe transport [Epilithonimonas arachidiradicis]GGG46888.1 TonB-dependent receptor [Epilithonimonas arachidiradicis]
MKTKTLIAAIFFSGLIYAQETPKKDSAETKSIEAVTLTKQVFKKQSDRFVYDVAASPVAKGNTAFSLLKQTPLVSSTDDKTLKIIGKNNAVIYINGRKTNMDAESLTQFLKNTPAENIQKIEVITLPGSEYQVESSDGIINIILKKKMTDGLNGNMRMGNSQNYYNSTYAGVSLNYRKNKLGVSANINTSENIQEQYYILRNGNDKASNQSEGRVTDPNKNLGGYLNIDYQLNDNSNLALTWNSWANRSYGSTSNLFNTINSKNDAGIALPTKYNYTKNLENARSYNNSLNLNYEWKTDTLGSKLNLNAAYLNYKRFQNADNKTFDSDIFQNLSQYPTIEIKQSTPQVINNFSFLGDYIKKFKNDFTVSVGGNFNKTKTDNDTQSTTTVFDASGNPAELFENGVRIDNPKENPNHFIYDENIYGVYLTLEKKFSDKFSGKIGSRYEMTNSVGKSDNTKNESLRNIERNYNNLLPYVSLNYAINDNNNISYAFSSRMRRPSFWELNPVKNILTDVNYTQNNPFVKASSVYTNEFTYMFKNSYFLIINHSFTKNVITQVPLQREIVKDGINYKELRYIRTNFGDKQEMSAMIGMQKSFFKQYLTSNFNIGMQRNVNNGFLNTDPITGDVFPDYVNKIKSNSLLIQTNNTVRLDKNKTWFLGVNYWYVDNQQIELGRLKSLMSLDANIKKVWNDWTFALEIYDILKTNKVVITDYQDNGNFNYINQNQYNQGLNFSVTYNFGNKKVQKIRDISSADKDIKNRTR